MPVFEAMLRICGHENLLAGMALEPEWVKEMAMDYARLIVKLQTKLFEREGLPDAVWYYEDLGYKQSPFMSPQMYCDHFAARPPVCLRLRQGTRAAHHRAQLRLCRTLDSPICSKSEWTACRRLRSRRA